MHQEEVKVIQNENISPGYFKIGLKLNNGYGNAVPGQFVMLRLPGKNLPLLRRPFSIHRLIFENDHIAGIEILYKIAGECTKKLSEIKKGKLVDILGPLGNGFPVYNKNRKIFIAAGGIGVAPLVFLARQINKSGIVFAERVAFLGGRSKDDILCKNDFAALQFKTHVSTEDGSLGQKGLVTKLLENALEKSLPDIIYACGPHMMLKKISSIAEKFNISCLVSIETVMACGIGACLGCAVDGKITHDKYLHACIDGPVFNVKDIKI